MAQSYTAFLEAIKHFPRWMDIRKRPLKSIGGHFLRSIIEELDEIQKAIIDYKKDFFIINYIGREDTVIDYLYAAQVGDIDDDFVLETPALTITNDVREFYYQKDNVALWQNGYLLFGINSLTDDKNINYRVNGYRYSTTAEKMHIWNIIDEFAMFSGLTRYSDETNKQLLKRILLEFQNPTNSSETGLKNAIINSVANYYDITTDEIIIERPDENNLTLEDTEYGTIYERLVRLNKDIMRTKQWDISLWEHAFKTIDYLPHVWDAPVNNYQNGVGHNNSLQVMLTDELQTESTTDVSLTGYKKSDLQIEEYIKSNNIETDIDLTIKKYDNTLIAKEIEYKITASEAKELAANNIFIDCYQQNEGKKKYYIADLIVDPGDNTIIQRGNLEPNSTYKVKFRSEEVYADMKIANCDLIRNDELDEDLLIENGPYIKVDGILTNTDVKVHATSVKDFKTFKNIADTTNGVTLETSSQEGSFAIDVSGMNGKMLKIAHSCRAVNITENTSFVRANGFELVNGEYTASSINSDENIVIELNCNYIAWELDTAIDPSMQGSCSVEAIVDGKIDLGLSGLYVIGQTIEKSFDKMTSVKITIQKAGMNPVTIKNIMASRYELSVKTEKGTIITTPMSTLLPIVDDNINTLHVTIKSYSAFSPIINYVHIGSTLLNAVYETKEINTGSDQCRLNIDSNCIAELYKVTNNTEELVETNYITRATYRNDTAENTNLIIDVSGFTSINSSIPVIEKVFNDGRTISFITLSPGQTIDMITIDGKSLILLNSLSLASCLGINDKVDKVYVSKAIKGFIVQNSTTYSEHLVELQKSVLNYQADTFKIRNLPKEFKTTFTLDKINNIENVSESFDENFESLYIMPNETQTHIAYNKYRMLQPMIKNIQIVDTFMPLIDTSKLMVYYISEIVNKKTTGTVLFEKMVDGSVQYENWSLGKKTYGLKIEIDLDHNNNNNYEFNIKTLNKKFIVSNHISLDDEYSIDGEIIDLAEYIIETPDNMRVNYIDSSYEENITVEVDGFNKLRYSNIKSLRVFNGDIEIPSSSYNVLLEEGIIVWLNDDMSGIRLQCKYVYRVPQYLSFTNLEHLYELVGYTVEAYKVINEDPIIIKNLSDSQSVSIEFEEQPDRIISICSNPGFQSKIEDNRLLRVFKISSENVAAVHNGYYYDNGLEYYYFAAKYKDTIDRLNGVELVNTKRKNNSLQLIQQSTNFLPNTSMLVARTGELCNIDFKTKNIDGTSRIDSLTACDSYNCWYDYNMEVSLTEYVNGLALSFNAEDGNAYAIMDITKYVDNSTMISILVDGDINIDIAKNIMYNGNDFTKSLYVEPYIKMQKQNNVMFFVFDNNTYDSQNQYYLLVTGSGVIDDVIIKNFTNTDEIESVHTKNIDKLGLSIKEPIVTNYLHKLIFDSSGNKFDGLQINQNGLIQTGSTVDWGLTKIADINLDRCELQEAVMHKSSIVASSNNTVITTPTIYLNNKKSVKTFIVKVNNVIMNSLKGFNITIMTAEKETGIFTDAVNKENTNMLTAVQTSLSNYIRIKVAMPKDTIINTIEVFAEYVENEHPLHITNKTSGSVITKVYDTGYNARFKIKGLTCSHISFPERITISVRACRQNDSHFVWTEWKDLKLDENMNCIGDSVIYDNYRLFQFRISLSNSDAEINVQSINIEVME